MGKKLILFALLWFPVLVWAQEKQSAPTAGLAFGMYGHSHGFGFDVRYFMPGEDKTWYLGLSLASLKNPREFKVESAYKEQGGKDYIFDKLNYCYVLAPTVGVNRSLIQRNLFNRVGLSATVGAGPLLALLKPYYLMIATPTSGGVTESLPFPYDPTQHNYTNIVGEADYFLGMSDLSMSVGGRAKAGVLVDFSAGSSYIRAVELSLYADVYANRVPLLGLNTNKQLFVGGAVEILVGNYW